MQTRGERFASLRRRVPGSADGRLEIVSKRLFERAGEQQTPADLRGMEALEWGADQTLLIMQSDQIPHDKVMRSIKLFGEQVIPAFKN